MQINIEDKNLFNKKVREKLENHKVSVDPALWESIESGIPLKKNKKRFMLSWWLGSGMAAAVAILLLFTPSGFISDKKLAHSNSIQNITLTKNTNTTQPKLSTNKSIQIDKGFSQHKKNNNTLYANNLTKSKSTSETIPSQKDSLAKNNLSLVADNLSIKMSEQNTANTNDSANFKTKPTKKEVPDLKQNIWEDPVKTKSSTDWELVAMVGGVGKSTQNSNAVFQIPAFAPRSGIVEAKTTATNIFSPQDFSDKTYLAPISGGIAVSKKLTQKVSIETGLNYTYLLSTFKNNQISASLNLHYLGIPAKITYKITTTNKWTLYSGIGGMLEKGLWSVYQQKQEFSGQTITTTVSDKIDGVQWSLNAGIGGEYNLTRNAAIYFEPKISYYFDNNQPLSIRTENKWVVGFEGGLRYKF